MENIVVINNEIVFSGSAEAAMAYAAEHKDQKPVVTTVRQHEASLARKADRAMNPQTRAAITRARNQAEKDAIQLLKAGQLPDGAIREAADFLLSFNEKKYRSFNIIRRVMNDQPLTVEQIGWIFSEMAKIKKQQAARKRILNILNA